MTTDIDPDGITNEVMTITPEMAERWLESNTRNRNLRKARAESYAHDMRVGKWEFNGETIKIADDGTVIDGQHRLYACVLAGVPFVSLVVIGLSATVQTTVDKSIVRNFSDTLTFNGEGDSQTLASVLRRITFWERGQFMHSPRQIPPTETEMLEVLVRYPGARESVRYGVTHATHSGLHRSIMSFMHWLLTAVDEKGALYFLDRVSDGVGLPQGHPALALRDRLRKERDRGLMGNYGVELTLALTVIAWNMCAKGLSSDKILLPKGGLSDESFPRPRQPRADTTLLG